MRSRTLLLFLIGFTAILTAGWIGFPRVLYRTEKQPVDFSHHIHKEQAAQKCIDCHQDNSTPAIASCAGCHAEPIGTTAQEKAMVVSYVKPGREIPWQGYARQPMNVRFPHTPHVKIAKIACEKCHGPHGDSNSLGWYEEDRISTYSRGAIAMSMSACEDCHRQKGVETGCLGCHK